MGRQGRVIIPLPAPKREMEISLPHFLCGDHLCL